MSKLTKLLRGSGLAAFGAVALCCALAATTLAQAPPPPGGDQAASNPVCVRFEAQLASLNRGGNDPARADQIRRYEESIAKQQGELDRTLVQSKKAGCEGGGFFALFTGGGPQCLPLNGRSSRCATTSIT